MSKSKLCILIIVYIASLYLVLKWGADHDKKVDASAEKYAQCVRTEYGVEPYQYYAEHKNYPTCPSVKN